MDLKQKALVATITSILAVIVLALLNKLQVTSTPIESAVVVVMVLTSIIGTFVNDYVEKRK